MKELETGWGLREEGMGCYDRLHFQIRFSMHFFPYQIGLIGALNIPFAVLLSPVDLLPVEKVRPSGAGSPESAGGCDPG